MWLNKNDMAKVIGESDTKRLTQAMCNTYSSTAKRFIKKNKQVRIEKVVPKTGKKAIFIDTMRHFDPEQCLNVYRELSEDERHFRYRNVYLRYIKLLESIIEAYNEP